MPESLSLLYKRHFGKEPESVIPVSAQGSGRRYYRFISDGQSAIGAIGDNISENKAFIYLSHKLRDAGINAPEIYAVNDDFTRYLQQDLGDLSLFDAIATGRQSGQFTDYEKYLLHLTMHTLPEIQYNGASVVDFSKCYPLEKFDRRSILWDLYYFKYCYLKNVIDDIDEVELENEFDLLSGMLLGCTSQPTFLYRDFQSRNVMVKDGTLWFIDFQGARQGPPFYDVASFLWQARASYPDSLREELIDTYLESASRFATFNRDSFFEALHLFVFFRQLQTLGAYGFRGLIQRKDHFIKSIPAAITNTLKTLNGNPALKASFPYISSSLQAIASRQETDKPAEGRLTVTVGSFSYKKSLPADPSGNGGGFIFDCRGMHNPGRYDQYKQLTGRDRPVIEFLEERGEVQEFVSQAFDMVKKSIATYLRRGFTSLSVWFGCTGGQHRSVYCADAFAALVSKHFPETIVRLVHREQPQLGDTVLGKNTSRDADLSVNSGTGTDTMTGF